MEIILIKQVLVMFLLMAVGFTLHKQGLFSPTCAKDLGAILVKLVIPVVIIQSFLSVPAYEMLQEIAQGAVLSAIAMLVALVVSSILFGRRLCVEKFASFTCNAGFVGIPLVSAVFGSHLVLHIGILIALNNLAQWTYGVFALTNDLQSIRPKKVLLGPGVLSIAIGFLLVFLRVPIPDFFQTALGQLSNLSAPLSMLLLGNYLAQTKPASFIGKRSLWYAVLCRLIVIPLATLWIFALLPVGDATLKMAILLAASTPVGANIVVFTSEFCGEYEASTQSVCLSTLLSVVTLPVFFAFAWKVIG